MKRPALLLVLLIVTCFGVAAGLEPWFEQWEGNRSRSGDLLAVAMGDGRKLFARHFYAKADAYFHSGYYPSIFDYKQGFENDKLSQKLGRESPAAQDHECATDFLGPPRDWIDGFSRHFFPSRHVHLGQEQSGHVHDEHCEHDHSTEPVGDQDHDHGEGANPTANLKEILPWVRISASLDPEHVETYLIGAYWLRTEMGIPKEAEKFLREGLRAMPLHPALLFELGRIYYDDHHDAEQARNLWVLAMKQWQRTQAESKAPEPDFFLYGQILGNLARLEEGQQRWAPALEYLQILKTVSPYPDHIQKWINEIQEGQP